MCISKNNFIIWFQIGFFLLLFPFYSFATSGSGPFSNNSIFVWSPMLFPTYSIQTNSNTIYGGPESTYTFTTEIEFFSGLPPIKSDLYFGIISPDNETFSWVKDNSEIVIKKGLLPIVKEIENKENTTFSLSNVLGGDIKYVATGKEPKGMYLVFALSVSAGSDPSQNKNWLNINMRPLFVE